MTTAVSELKQRWTIVLACTIGVGTGVTGLPFYTLGLFVLPLQEQFGWSRAETQGMFTIFTFAGLACVPFIGFLVDRYGVRRVVLTSLLGAAVGFALIGLATESLASFYLLGGLLAVLAAGTSPISWTRAITGWFDKQRGIALGLALAGTGIAGWLAPQYVASLLAQFGWREAYIGLAVLPAIAWFFVYWLLEDPPSPVLAREVAGDSLVTDDRVSSPAAPANQADLGISLHEALRQRHFWLIGVGFFLVSMGVGGSIPNLVPLMVDAGISVVQAAAYVSWLGLSVIVGRVVAGLLIDRFWAPGVAAIMLSLPAVAALLLSQGALSPTLLLLSIGLIGLAAGAEFDLIAFLVGRYFGTLHYAKIYALLYALFMFGAGIAPPLFGYCYDLLGSYQPILLVSAGLFVVGAGLLLLLGRYPSAAR